MALTLKIRFLTGRYHATAWQQQVNEGIPDWPPSPWRLLRALVAAAYRLPQPPPRSDLLALVNRLSEHLPHYGLPETTLGHTRHYMPIRKEGEDTTTLVLDTFVAFSADATLWVTWPQVQLPLAQRQLLEQLCRHLSYLGRAESWVDVTVLDDNREMFTGQVAKVAKPLSSDGVDVSVWSSIELLAPQPPAAFAKARKHFPTDVLAALELDVGKLHDDRWSGIPGTRWVRYEIASRPRSSSRAVRSSPFQDAPAFARFVLVGSVLPKLSDALSVGERCRQALMSLSKGHWLFAGRDPATGTPLQGHVHSWFFPEDADQDGFIDHVLVYAAKGFDKEALAALRRLRQIWSAETREGKLQLLLVQLGFVKDYTCNVHQAIPGVSSLLMQARTWRTVTPWVPSRHSRKHPKKDPRTGLDQDSLAHQVVTQIDHLRRDGWLRFTEPPGWSWAEQIQICSQKTWAYPPYPWYAFRRQRTQGQGAHAGTRAYWVQVTFPEPITGPLALGYASHFGLGLFQPVE